MSDEIETLKEAVKDGLYAEFSTESAQSLLTQFTALERDALRYRWLRSQRWSYGRGSLVVVNPQTLSAGAQMYSAERLDAAIDGELKPT